MGAPLPKIKVIGIGSSQADDRLGWDVAEALLACSGAAAYGDRLEIAICRSPASELLGLLARADVAVIVDAVKDQGAPGTVYRWVNVDSLASTAKVLSSHGVALQTLLMLADALGYRPSIVVYGIETISGDVPDADSQPALRRAVLRVTEDIKREIANRCGLAPTSVCSSCQN